MIAHLTTELVMDNERIVIVEGLAGTRFRVVSRGQDAEGDATEFFNGALDKSGQTRVPVSIAYVVVTGFPGGGGSIPVVFEKDEREKRVRLPT
jgi:hypothetical protein